MILFASSTLSHRCPNKDACGCKREEKRGKGGFAHGGPSQNVDQRNICGCLHRVTNEVERDGGLSKAIRVGRATPSLFNGTQKDSGSTGAFVLCSVREQLLRLEGMGFRDGKIVPLTKSITREIKYCGRVFIINKEWGRVVLQIHGLRIRLSCCHIVWLRVCGRR